MTQLQNLKEQTLLASAPDAQRGGRQKCGNSGAAKIVSLRFASLLKGRCATFFQTKLKSLRTLARHARFEVNGKRLIREYLASHKLRKLQIGVGSNVHEGWLNSDLQPARDDILYLDGTKPFPFDDCTFDYVFNEHMIEHITYSQGVKMLEECLRVLKPGGVLRIATPNVSFLIDLYRPDKTKLQQDYIEWAFKWFVGSEGECQDLFVINNFMRNWGHLFIYDEKVLKAALAKAGFTDIIACPLNQSAHSELRDLENEKRMPPGFLALETMVLEAIRPWPQSDGLTT